MKKCSSTFLLALLILYFIQEPGISQNSVDTADIDALTKRSFDLRLSDPDSCALLAKEAIKLSESIHYMKGLGDGYMYLGILQKNVANYDSALVFYKKSLGYRKQLPTPTDAGK